MEFFAASWSLIQANLTEMSAIWFLAPVVSMFKGEQGCPFPGLRNRNNRCYLNSLLQALASLPPNILSTKHPLLNDLFQTVKWLRHKSSCLDYVLPGSWNSDQQDPHEFYLAMVPLLEKTHKCSLLSLSAFEGTCLEGGKVTPFSFILVYSGAEEVNFEDNLLTMPCVLVLLYLQPTSATPRLKLSHQGIVYSLASMIIRRGHSAYSGHYYAVCKRGNAWIKADDEHTEFVKESQISEYTPYMSFYELRR